MKTQLTIAKRNEEKRLKQETIRENMERAKRVKQLQDEKLFRKIEDVTHKISMNKSKAEAIVSQRKLEDIETNKEKQIVNDMLRLAHSFIMDIYMMIRRQKTTIFTDAKENTSVMELKRILEGILKVSPENQKLFIQKYFDKMSEECTSSSKEIEEILEKELQLIGSTAIEDQLQDNVADTIESIRSAGVKIWMLTGDKKETAINIGYSCGLVERDMAVVSWQETVEQTIQARQQYGNRHCCLVATGNDLLNLKDQQLLL